MNNQAKMIIITSNEDLINQLSINQSNDTRIIDLDEKKLNNSIPKENNNFLDLTFLSHLSELNSNNDQMYKRVLDSPRQNRSKIARIPKKSVDLICVICGDNAIGFNYDALTCASCKAFFRRNAQYRLEQLRCLTGQKKCLINHSTPRKCQRCRLEKCFSNGMRKDFILTEEEKQRRRKRLEENRQLSNDQPSLPESMSFQNNQFVSEPIDEIDRLLMDTDDDNIVSNDNLQLNTMQNSPYAGLSIEDWSEIENVRSSYSSIFPNGTPSCNSFDTSDRTSALICWSEFASQRSLKLINFFQQIDEFEHLNSDDRFTLIKYNLLPLYVVHRSTFYNLLTGTFENSSTEDVLKRRQFFLLCYGTSGIRESYKDLICSFSALTEQDRTSTNLILIILLFSKGLSMSENEPLLNDSSSVNKAQSHYITLLWNYLVYKYGQFKTTQQFTQLLRQIMKLQSYTKLHRDFFRKENQSTDMLERLAPLMQSVLNIA